MPTPEQVKQIIEHLQGSAQSLGDGVRAVLGDGCDEDDLTTEDCAMIDEHIFLCDVCGWWCEESERSQGNSEVCQECAHD